VVVARGRAYTYTLADVSTAGGIGHDKGQSFIFAEVAVDYDVWWSSVLEDWIKSGYTS